MRLAFVIALVLLALPAPADDGGIRVVNPAEFQAELGRHENMLVIVNLWATWCVPCLKEIPDLRKLADEFADDGVVLIAVAMDDPYESARVDAFRRKHFPGFRSLMRGTTDMDSVVSVVDPAWNEVLPTTYLLGRDGQVIRRIQGKKSYDEFSAIVSEAL